jgi:hypothetical protein
MKRSVLWLAALALLWGGVGPATAGPAYTVLSAGYGNGYTVPQTAGDVFTATTDIIVTALGFIDINHTGLRESHEVGIFLNSSQCLIARETVPAGIGGRLDGDFRYIDIAPVPLQAGEEYTIAGAVTERVDQDLVGYTTVSGIAYDPSITSDSYPSRYVFGGPGLVFPSNFGVDYGFYVVANFKIDSGGGGGSPSANPEPASLTLLGLGVLGLLGYAWQHRKR